MAERETGTVKWSSASRGYGFIARDKGEDLFVYFSGIRGEACVDVEGIRQGELTSDSVSRGFLSSSREPSP